MTLVAPKRIQRDCLTGVPLRAGLPTYVVHVPTQRKKPRYLEAEGDTLSAPLKLHRSETDAGGLGGLMYHAMMAEYLHLALNDQQKRERLAMLAWWRSAYGTYKRVLPGLVERFGDDEAQHVLAVVIACHREQADPADIGAQFGHSEQWVIDRVRLCMRLAHWHRRDCACSSCEQRRRSR